MLIKNENLNIFGTGCQRVNRFRFHATKYIFVARSLLTCLSYLYEYERSSEINYLLLKGLKLPFIQYVSETHQSESLKHHNLNKWYHCSENFYLKYALYYDAYVYAPLASRELSSNMADKGFRLWFKFQVVIYFKCVV